ncbi:hypothetical protein [Massilia sp.]|uniref:hypothetical protein n=1 Tax=Massilia sp. TaxID=1882437 RepID=UPI0028A8E5A4|nr:hypothetical protein [Massilia sp.]
MDEFLDFLQWPAMAVSLYAAYLIGSQRAGRRVFGFWMFILSNLLWIVWGVHDEAWALIALQVALMAMNIRGIWKNDAHESTPSAEAGVDDAPTAGAGRRSAGGR